LSEKNFYLKY